VLLAVALDVGTKRMANSDSHVTITWRRASTAHRSKGRARSMVETSDES